VRAALRSLALIVLADVAGGIGLACAASPAPLDLQSALDAGWQEAVISVRDPRPLLRFMTEVAGWRVRSERALTAGERAFYQLNDALLPQSPRRTAARQWLITDDSGRPGFVRLIAFNAPDAVQIRSGAMPWDTGGILSLMSRSNATAELYGAAQRLGWDAWNDPVELQMRDTGVTLTNVILRGPDGVNISIYERLAPRMPDEPDLRHLRRPFNSMQGVLDLAVARRFYVEVLGFEVLNAGRFENSVRAPNNFGAPGNLVTANPLQFAIVGPQRSGPTQVELVQMTGIEGRDHSARAAPPNYGIMALRFPVSRLAALQERLSKGHWPIARGPALLDMPPYGRVRMLAVQAPDGAWLEFYERVKP
jgi:catechol 2,3-dioxygenase-like lactoylglutathione lyase family enzyme